MKKVICGVLLVLCFQINVLALGDAKFTVNCEKDKLSIGESAKCNLNITSGVTTPIKGLNLNIVSDSDFELSFLATSPFTGNLDSKRLVLSTTKAKTGNINVGVLTVKVGSAATYGSKKIDFKDIQITSEGDLIVNNNISKTIDVLSAVNTLDSIAIDGIEIPGFSKEKNSYEVKSNATKIKLSATLTDDKSKIEGLGEKIVNYGKNSYNIKVTSQNGKVKTYTIIINKEDRRSKDNTLKQLKVEGINFIFDKKKLSYKLNVDSTMDKLKVNAILNHDKASFVKDFGSRETNLNYGNNLIEIKVKAENGDLKTYILNINREDNRSDVSYIKSLVINGKKVDIKEDVYEYKVDTHYKYDKTNITVSVNDKSKVEYKDISLKVGLNELIIKTISEKGTFKEYKIIINRLTEKESQIVLENIIVTGYDIGFSKNITTYNLKIDNDVTKLDIKVLPLEGIITKIDGNENLVNGSTIVINIKDDVEEHVYKINIEKDVKEKLLFGFLTLEQLSFIIFTIGFLTFFGASIYAVKENKKLKK